MSANLRHSAHVININDARNFLCQLLELVCAGKITLPPPSRALKCENVRLILAHGRSNRKMQHTVANALSPDLVASNAYRIFNFFFTSVYNMVD